MAKLRSVNVKFWTDDYIEDLSPTEKLLFLYLLTNPLSNLAGVYEISIKRISYETAIDKPSIAKILEKFERDGKICYIDGFIIIPNHSKHQKLNNSMQMNVDSILEDLPEKIRGIAHGDVRMGQDASSSDKGKGKDKDKGKENSIDKREKDFEIRVFAYDQRYSHDLLCAFTNYWTERSKDGKRMRFEDQKFFDIPKRLATWKSREKKEFRKPVARNDNRYLKGE